MLVRKVKGFTLFELLIVMLISAILLGIVYHALQIANNSYISFSRETNRLLGLKTLVQTMQQDLVKADQVIASSDNFRCYSSGEVISYAIRKGSITRSINSTEEVFPYGPETCTFYFNQSIVKPVEEPIDGIELTFSLKGEALTFTLDRHQSFYDRFKKFSKTDN